jgi:type I restriction enzyme M protein
LADYVQSFARQPETNDLGQALEALGLLEAQEYHDLNSIVQGLRDLDLGSLSPSAVSGLIDRLLERGVENQGWRGGDYYTPSEVSRLLSSLLAITPAKAIYDPACGTGSLLLTAHQRMIEVQGEAPQLFGQEIRHEVAALACVNMALHNVGTATIVNGDTLTTPRFVDHSRIRRFDAVICNPPIGLGATERRLHEYDPFGRFPYGLSRYSGDVAFLMHIVASLSETGRAVTLVRPTFLFASGQEGRIRRELVDSDQIEAVITLPGNLLFNTAIPVAILVLRRQKPPMMCGKVLFIYAEAAVVGGRRASRLRETEQDRIVALVREPANVKRFAAVVEVKTLAEQEWNLSPSRYVGLADFDTFLGGSVQWMSLTMLASIYQGGRIPGEARTHGNVAFVRGRDLSASNLTVDDLPRCEIVPAPDVIRAADGDILIQRTGLQPHTHVVDEALAGVIIDETVFVIRLNEPHRGLARYLTEFFASAPGQALLAMSRSGTTVPTLRLSDLRRLCIPIPEAGVVDLVTDLHQIERDFLERVEHARTLRQQLFSIEDAERAGHELRQLSTAAQVLAASLIQSDSLDYRVRNFYPFPLAFGFRTLGALREPVELYKEQLRVAENILAFLGSVGVALAAFARALPSSSDRDLPLAFLSDCWDKGISPGSWQEMGRRAGQALRSHREVAIADAFSSLWFRGSGSRESDFGALTKQLAKLKNDFKHDRGPDTPLAYMEQTEEMDGNLRRCLLGMDFFISYPIRLVQHTETDWRTEQAIIDTLVYVGDHPGLKKEQKVLPSSPPRDKLYIEVTKEKWASLYPLISVQYCDSCKTRETYMIDRWDQDNGRLVLKSFERGHVHDDDRVAKRVAADLKNWLERAFGGNSS